MMFTQPALHWVNAFTHHSSVFIKMQFFETNVSKCVFFLNCICSLIPDFFFLYFRKSQSGNPEQKWRELVKDAVKPDGHQTERPTSGGVPW